MKYYVNIIFLIIILILAAFIIINPREAVTAATFGIKLWAAIVLPALFPFFIIAELLVSLRLVNFLGVLLDPVMRPLFRLPGCSSLAVVMGFTSGFPMGAILTRRLYEDHMLTGDEAERLACFTNNCSPLFILGAVGVGMFNLPLVGYLMAGAHYISNLLIGLLLRFRHDSDSMQSSKPVNRNFIKHACQELYNYPEPPPQPGKLLGDAIKAALTNVMAVGGFIVAFSILTRMLTIWGFMDMAAWGIIHLLSRFDLTYPIAYGISLGLLEITIGSSTVATATADLLSKLIAISGIMAFSGFSIIAQVLSILTEMPVRLTFYLKIRLLQVVLATGLVTAGYHLFAGNISITSFSLPLWKAAYSFDAWSFSLHCLAVSAAIILIIMIIGINLSRN